MIDEKGKLVRGKLSRVEEKDTRRKEEKYDMWKREMMEVEEGSNYHFFEEEGGIRDHA